MIKFFNFCGDCIVGAIDRIFYMFDTLEDFIAPDFHRFYGRLSKKDKKIFQETIELLKDGESVEVTLNNQKYVISK